MQLAPTWLQADCSHSLPAGPAACAAYWWLTGQLQCYACWAGVLSRLSRPSKFCMGKQPAKGRAKKQQKSQEAPAPEAAPKRDKVRPDPFSHLFWELSLP